MPKPAEASTKAPAKEQPANVSATEPADPAEPAESASDNDATGEKAARPVVAVIDGNSLMHRAFHAIPPTMSAPDGTPTGALFGFVSMVLKMIETFRPDAVVCAFDKGRPARRIALLPQYKAQRPPTDPLLLQQLPLSRDVMRAMGVPVFEEEGWEGDDILGTLATQGEQMGCDMLLVSGDRDVYQLVTDHVRVVNTKKGLTDVVVYDPAGVTELYDGITPSLVPDFYGLKGDTSDNIPGVPGIGPKKASSLINEYGSLEGVLDHADEIKGKMGENIRAHKQDALVSRQIATIERTAPVQLDLDDAAWPDFDTAELRRFFGTLGFATLEKRTLSLANAAAGGSGAGTAGDDDGSGTEDDAAQSHLPRVASELVEGDEAWKLLEDAAASQRWISVRVSDAETESSQATLFDEEPCLQAYIALESGWVVDEPSAAKAADGPSCGPSSPHSEPETQDVQAAQDSQDAPAAQATVSSPGHPSESPARVLYFSGDEPVKRALAFAYERCRVVSCDVKADLHVLVPTDSSIEARIDVNAIDPAHIFDLSVAAYMLDSDRSDYALDKLANVYAGILLPVSAEKGKGSSAGEKSGTGKSGGAKGEGAKGGAGGKGGDAAPDSEGGSPNPVHALEAAAQLALFEILTARMEDEGATRCFEEIEMPLIPVLVNLERAGMTVSRQKLGELSAELASQIDDLSAQIYEEAGEQFNIDSPMQLSHVLFDEDKKVRIPVTRSMKKTRSGYYSTNAKMLEELAADYPIVEHILEYREKAKIKSTYLDALPLVEERYGDGRVHTTYNQTVTATGRLSSSDPNLQNIPIRSELGRMVRTAFVPADPETSCILGCDYSQIELRLLAHLSGDEGLIAAFTEGEDFHRETAARVFGVDPKDVTPLMRSRAKAVNFGIVYGQQAYGLSTSLKISRAEAQEMIDRYFIKFPRVRTYLDELVDFAHAHGWVETMFGRRRHIPDISSRNPNLRAFGERTAMNHPMQGSAADIIKIAMARVSRRMAREGFRARMIVQVHDELDFDCPKDEVKELSALVSEEMTGVVQLKVPLVVSCAAGANWADAH
jgi:DNA polymerase-1